MKKLLSLILGIAITLATLTACGGVVDEKQAFIDATVEATCLIFQSDDLFDPALEEQTKDIYKKYGFPADDEDAMEELTSKYENDEEVQAAILAAIEDCSADFLEGMDDMIIEEETDVSDEDTTAEEEESTEESTEEEKEMDEEMTDETTEEEATEEVSQ
ncbi:hypothetical protein GF354_05940 [Candidatus Peregrinibacteria bacterium]|nr:hypothetical protein [Candidatus Peregrinibacteria bacterium]